jgi:hypothetical protein
MRAQFWSFDVIFAVVIFGTAIVLLTFVWTSISNQYSLSYGMGSINLQAQLQSLQGRILGQGTPANWNSAVNVSNTITWSNVSIGLGTGSGTALSPNKVMTFMAMSDSASASYQATKPLLGVGYEYYIVIYGNNMTMSFGASPYSNKATSIQVAMQSATLNGAPVSMRIMVWTNKTFGVS